MIQFGGASGTLASLGAHGMSVGLELAKEVGTGIPGRALARSP